MSLFGAATLARVRGARAWSAWAPEDRRGRLCASRRSCWAPSCCPASTCCRRRSLWRRSARCSGWTPAARVGPGSGSAWPRRCSRGCSLPLLVAYIGARRRREAPSARRPPTSLACFLPFSSAAPGGLLLRRWRCKRGAGRRSRASARGSLLAAHHACGLDLDDWSSGGSRTSSGAVPTWSRRAGSWRRWRARGVLDRVRRGPADKERLVSLLGGRVVAFVVFGKVLSLQFLIWLFRSCRSSRAAAGWSRLGSSLRRSSHAALVPVPLLGSGRSATGPSGSCWRATCCSRTLAVLCSPPLRPCGVGVAVAEPAYASRRSTRTASHAVARPSASHSTSTPSMRTSPSAGSKRTGMPGPHPLDRDLRLHADHRVVRAGHAGVGDRGRAARQDARVVRLHVRVRADHRRDAAVEPAGHRDLLARRLGVEVDDHDRRRSRASSTSSSTISNGLDRDVEEEPAHQVDDRDRRPVARPARRVRPRPGACREMFAGRTTPRRASR